MTWPLILVCAGGWCVFFALLQWAEGKRLFFDNSQGMGERDCHAPLPVSDASFHSSTDSQKGQHNRGA